MNTAPTSAAGTAPKTSTRLTLTATERVALIRDVFAHVFATCETFGADDVGSHLSYLLAAIADGGFVDWSPEVFDAPPALLGILRSGFAPDSALWAFVRLEQAPAGAVTV